MLNKLVHAFNLLRQDLSALKGDVQRLEKVRAVVKDGVDGVSPDPNEIIRVVLERIPTPKDGESPDPRVVAEAAARLIPEPKPGRDAVAPSVRDIADVVLANITPPKDGISPDPQAIAVQASKLIRTPKDGVSPTAQEVAKQIPAPKRGAPGKNGVSITDVQLNNNELFVFLDGKKQKAGKIKLPAISAPFNPGGAGGGGSARSGPFYEKVVVVREPKQLSGVLRSDVLYVPDGIIDFSGSGISIDVPVGGLSFGGFTFDVSGFRCTDDNYTLFNSPVGGSGNILGMDYFVEISGASSQVFDLTDSNGTHAFEFQRINYNNCSSLGEINGYRQGLEEGTGRFGGRPELTLTGAWAGGYFIDVSIVRGLLDGDYSLFKAGAGFVMQSRFRSNQNLDLPSLANFVDFAPSNFANPSTLQLQGCTVTRDFVSDASDPNLTPNISASDLASDWTNNNGLPNTFEGGELTISAEVTTLTGAVTAGDFLDLAGTQTASDLQHFDQPDPGQLRHLGTSPEEYKVIIDEVIESTANDDVSLKVVVFRSATTSFEDQKTKVRVVNNLIGGRNVALFNFVNNVILHQNDYVKIMVASSGANDVTAEIDSSFSVEAR